MADLAYPATPTAQPGAIQGRARTNFTILSPAPAPASLQQDRRHLTPTTGTVTDQVVLKTAGGELPFANGRVWLLRLADGYKAWEGWSDASGNYSASGLELGVKYVAVAIDPYNNQKATGAGPVTAT